MRSVIREGRDDKENRQENLPAEGGAGAAGTKKRKRGHGGALAVFAVDPLEATTPAPQASAPAAPQAPRTTTPPDRAADCPTLDWGEDDDDEVDWKAVDAIEAEHRQGQMSGVAIDVDGTEGTLHD